MKGHAESTKVRRRESRREMRRQAAERKAAKRPQSDWDDYPYPVWHTDGGGIVELAPDEVHYVFVEAPAPCMKLGVGDPMPDYWCACASANKAAKEEEEYKECAERAEEMRQDLEMVYKDLKGSEDLYGRLLRVKIGLALLGHPVGELDEL